MNWPLQAAESWKLSLPCTKAEAEALAADPDPLPGLDPPPVLMTSEPDPDRPENWQLDAYFEEQPEQAGVALVQRLVPSAAGVEPLIEQLGEEDWVTLSQQGLEPIRAGRFFVYTPAHRSQAPAEGVIALEVDAGRAFGTGHHETTTGCLLALDRLKGKVRYQPIGFELLPPRFTLGQLQALYETVLERPLDKRNFRKKILSMGVLVETDEVQQDVAHRAARLYRFDERRYEKLRKKGFNFEV